MVSISGGFSLSLNKKSVEQSTNKCERMAEGHFVCTPMLFSVLFIALAILSVTISGAPSNLGYEWPELRRFNNYGLRMKKWYDWSDENRKLDKKWYDWLSEPNQGDMFKRNDRNPNIGYLFNLPDADRS
uniref:Uncharacterized protein n=1 Tax=Syphacia muris TaxID=451379 RepID=A0A0N5AFL5_9BILA